MSRASAVVALTAALCLGACSSTPEPSRTYTFVFDQVVLSAPQLDDNGDIISIDGLDLDGADGPVPFPEGVLNPCSLAGEDPDYVSRDGQPGVDNILGANLQTFAQFVGGDAQSADQLRAIVQGSVSAGLLVVLLELEGVDSLVEDDSVTARIYVGARGNVAIGTDGRLLSGQTFPLNPDVPPFEQEVQIIDGVVELRSIQTRLVGAFADVSFEMPVETGRLQLEFRGEGVVTGLFGAAVSWNSVADAVTRIGGFDPGLGPTVFQTMRGIADVFNEETGECSGLSTTFRVHGVSAFIFEGDNNTSTTPDAGL